MLNIVYAGPQGDMLEFYFHSMVHLEDKKNGSFVILFSLHNILMPLSHPFYLFNVWCNKIISPCALLQNFIFFSDNNRKNIKFSYVKEFFFFCGSWWMYKEKLALHYDGLLK